MSPNATRAPVDCENSTWFSSEVQSLQSQMAMLQAALESSKTAVAEFHRRAAANLEASEQRYQELFDNVLTGVYRLGSDGHILLANPALIRMLGYESFDELAARKLSPPGRIANPSHPPQLIGFERTWKKKNGERITVRESCRAFRDETGAVLYYEGVVEDITVHKKAEVFEQDCRALLELVARNEPIDRILHKLVRLIERQTPGAACMLMLAREHKLYPVVGPNLPPGFLTALASGVPIIEGSTSCGAASVRRQACIAEDILTSTQWTAFRQIAEAYGLRSCWSMPICSGTGTLLGTIAVYRRQPHSPEYAEIQIVETTSRLASVAVEHRQLYEDLERQATRDYLTGLPNRAMFEERLARVLEDAGSRSGEGKVALFWIDLDRFKEINETLGHRLGDELIAQVAARLQPVIGTAALLARTGGDEFAILNWQTAGTADAQEYASRILSALHAPFQVSGCEIFVSASMGIAIYPQDGESAMELQQNADAAMYQVKSQGRNGFGFYEATLGDCLRDRVELTTSLRRALTRNEFELHFQPQTDLDGKLRGFEALLRWNHPTKGLLYPGNFIGIAEETGLVVAMGAWVIREACRRSAEWNRMWPEPLTIAVNVSALQFYFSDLTEVVKSALRDSGLDPKCLELELTESLLMKDADQSSIELEKLRALGVTIAIDDFGTGYSSLSYLQRLPVDMLKIDRSFLEQIESETASAVIQAITALAHALGLRVVAEGVEKHHQMRAMRHLGVDLMQGYLIGRPVPAATIDRLLRNSGPRSLSA
jgi:diguanylate cyclase (GGDEF)-like protein